MLWSHECAAQHLPARPNRVVWGAPRLFACNDGVHHGAGCRRCDGTIDAQPSVPAFFSRAAACIRGGAARACISTYLPFLSLSPTSSRPHALHTGKCGVDHMHSSVALGTHAQVTLQLSTWLPRVDERICAMGCTNQNGA